MQALDYIINKFGLVINHKPPIEINNINRPIMAETLAELGFNLGAEVGVAGGAHARLLVEKNPKLKLYCIDPWIVYEGYGDYDTHRMSQFERDVLNTMQTDNYVLMKEYSMDAVKKFEDNSLDFVYIDGAHDYKNVVDDICEWSKKVKVGGIVYGHDFKRSPRLWRTQQVVDAVQGYMYSHQIDPWFVLGTEGHKDGTPYKEGTRSWLYVKPEPK